MTVRICPECREEAHDNRLMICTSCGSDLDKATFKNEEDVMV